MVHATEKQQRFCLKNKIEGEDQHLKLSSELHILRHTCTHMNVCTYIIHIRIYTHHTRTESVSKDKAVTLNVTIKQCIYVLQVLLIWLRRGFYMNYLHFKNYCLFLEFTTLCYEIHTL